METDYLIRQREHIIPSNDGNVIDWNDSKIRFVTKECKAKKVLDLGCVQHDPEFAKSKKWLHKAICAVATEVKGLDLDSEGVAALKDKGYHDVRVGDAQHFDLMESFDVIVAGDLIEHLHNVGGFLESCAKHMTNDSKLLVCTPNPWHWHKWMRAFFRQPPVNEEHTLWMCPVTLSQVAARFGLKLVRIEYNSQRLKDLCLPIPDRVRHSSFYAVLKKCSV